MTEYEPVIGLEVHAELLTATKMFCSCRVVDSVEAHPNDAVCAVCTAQPGTLPVINHQAVEYAIMVGLALNCEINSFNQFARKSYFYPDLPKGYQISQYEYPICSNGWLDIDTGSGLKRIHIRRAHMEEDTGKLTHVGSYSLVDLNRAGVPLYEIVTEPDFRSVEELEAFARKLRAILIYLGVNHGDMSKGVLRFEANISVRPKGSDELRTRTEIKNLNSIRSLVRASDYEIRSQIRQYQSGQQVRPQTMGFNETTGATFTQRYKERPDEYRYFPEPDLPDLQIDPEWIARIRSGLPELPDARQQRFMEEYSLSLQDAEVLVSDKAVSEYFQAVVEGGADPKSACNWIAGELFRLMNETTTEVSAIRISPAMLVALIKLVEDGTINNTTAKDVFAEMFQTGNQPEQIVSDRGLAQISDTAALEALVEKVVAANPEEVRTYLSGKEGLMGWFVGQVMRETKGQANAGLVNKILREKLDAMKG